MNPKPRFLAYTKSFQWQLAQQGGRKNLSSPRPTTRPQLLSPFLLISQVGATLRDVLQPRSHNYYKGRSYPDKGYPPQPSALALQPRSMWPSSLLLILFSLLRELRKPPSQATALRRQKAAFRIKRRINSWAILKRKSTFAQKPVYFSQTPCLLYSLSFFSQLDFVSFFHCYKCSFIPSHNKARFTQAGVWSVGVLRQKGLQSHAYNCCGFSKSFY